MKSKNVAAVLAFFFGGLGVHKFYLGKTGLGIVYLIFCWTYIPSIIAFIEFILFLTMTKDDFDKKYNKSLVKRTVYSPVESNQSVNNAPTVSTLDVDNSVVQKVCGKCGCINDTDSRFCYKCGSQI